MGLKKLVGDLLSTTEEELEKIEKLKEEERWNDHTSDGGYQENYIHVDANYNFFIKKSPKRFFLNNFCCKPFVRTANKLLKTEVKGKENIKGIKGAIICCNHVNRLDCCVLKKGFGYKKTFFVAAEFNNLEGFLGDIMRIGGMLPLSDNLAGMKGFSKAVSKHLDKGHKVVIYPERAEWWCYKEPRPVIDGGFKMAVENNVPIIPAYITFEETEASKASRTGLPKFVLHIMKPIYSDIDKSRKENVEYLKNATLEKWNECYNETYKKETIQ